MKRKWLGITAALVIVFFVPLFPAKVVPEWHILLVDEAGEPMPNVAVNQIWKDYSFEWGADHWDHNQISDLKGNITLPQRVVRVSAFQFIAAKIWDVLPIVTFHGGHGPSSFVQCGDKLSCHASFQPNAEMPTIIVVKK